MRTVRLATIALIATSALVACSSKDSVAPPPPPSWHVLTPLASSAFGIARTADGHLLTTLILDGYLERVLLSNVSASHDGVNVGGTPSVIATSPDGGTFYVANMAGWVEARSSATGARTAYAAISDAHALSVAPDGSRLYVAGSAGNVYVLGAASLNLLATIPLPGGPWGMAFREIAGSSRLYVTARDAGTITEIDRSTNSVLRVFNVGGRPHGLVIAPDGRLFAADNQRSEIKIVDAGSGLVTKRIPFVGAFGLAITPDAKTIYASGDQGEVGIISVSAGSILQSWPTGGQARQIVTSADGNTAWFANSSGWIDVVTR
jgi:YVTN family beta-propeller protein